MNEAAQPTVSSPTPSPMPGSEPGSAPADQAQGAARTELAVRISPQAAEYARVKLERRGTPGAAIRLGVKGSGCSGFSYVIQFEDNPPRERDRVFEQGAVRFVVDKKSLVFLAGSLLDYEKTLMFQGFKFKNPREASTCGCGHSFNVK
jgi:iron-sulfur cluster assembly protein